MNQNRQTQSRDWMDGSSGEKPTWSCDPAGRWAWLGRIATTTCCIPAVQVSQRTLFSGMTGEGA
jgi:hypothetical protein